MTSEFTFIIFILFFPGLPLLKIDKLDVPKSLARGSNASLRCFFDLEGEQLYSVKWYKDYIEFYRYLPSNEPRSGQNFKLKGVNLDLSRSNANHAFLFNIDLDSEGFYACEVSSEGPSFSTVRRERQMKIYVIPSEGLSIDGSEPTSGIDNLINLTCSANPSNPAQSLIWYINDQKAPSTHLIDYPIKNRSDHLYVVKLGLVFFATANYFNKGKLQLICRSSITLVYQYEASIWLIGGTPKNKTFNGHYNWNKVQDLNFQKEEKTPIIEVGKEKYKVDSIINLNCSTTSPAVLKWFIKNQEANETQLIRYLNENNKALKLGLRFWLQKSYFQLQELQLQCLALYNYNIANFSKSITIQTYQIHNGFKRQFSIIYCTTSTNQVDFKIIFICSLILILIQNFFVHKRCI